MKFTFILSASLTTLLVAGCAEQRFDKGFYPSEVSERHPIEMMDEAQVLRVYPRKYGGLDERQAEDVSQFARRYRQQGRSEVMLRVPAGAGKSDPITKQTVASVRAELERRGVPRRSIRQASYDDAGIESIAPVFLSYRAAVAAVPHECGKWPFDLAGGGGGGGQISQAAADDEWWSNESWWNFGCAYQANIAAQALDPIDIQRPRTADSGDSGKRVNDIRALREGRDPSTTYTAESFSVQDAGGQ